MIEKRIVGGEYRIETDALQSKIERTLQPKYSLGRTCLYVILDAVKSEVGGGIAP